MPENLTPDPPTAVGSRRSVAEVNVGPGDKDRIFTSEQRTTERALRSNATGVPAALYALYRIADEKLDRELADAGCLPKREATITMRIELLGEVDDGRLP